MGNKSLEVLEENAVERLYEIGSREGLCKRDSLHKHKSLGKKFQLDHIQVKICALKVTVD